MQTSDLPVARQSENEKNGDDDVRLTDLVNLTTNTIENQEDSIAFFDLIKAVTCQEVAETGLVISRMNFSENSFEAEFPGLCDVFSVGPPWGCPCWPFQGVGSLAESVSKSRDVATSGIGGIFRELFHLPELFSLFSSDLTGSVRAKDSRQDVIPVE